MELSPTTKLTEGKTKIIWGTEDPTLVIIESKDDITAGDGVKHDIIPGKGVLSTETTINCFNLIERAGIATHYIGRYSDNAFIAMNAKMIPLEVVARREAVPKSSYLLRNPEVAKGTRFDPLIVEFFYKDDANHDPLIELVGEEWQLFNPKVPRSEGFLSTRPKSWLDLHQDQLGEMANNTRRVFTKLETAFGRFGVRMGDLKLEFGFINGLAMPSDVTDNDSWRIAVDGDWDNPLDKQAYRNISGQATPEQLEEIRKKYVQVSQMTQRFLY